MSEPSDDIIDCMARMKGDNQPFALATVVRTEDLTSAKAGAKAVIRADGSLIGWIGGGCTLGAVRQAAASALADGRARLLRVRPRPADEPAPEGMEFHKSHCPSGGTVEVFVEPILPRPSLFVLGASPTAHALADLGRATGFSVTVAALAEDQAGFAEADFRVVGFDLAPAARAATGFIVVATQGKRDRQALAAALACGAPYVAFVGSRKKASALKAAMREQGLPADRIEALHAPAGLDLGAATPQEIALSILAEIVQQRGQATRPSAAPPVQTETIDGGSYESRIVTQHPGDCQGTEGKH